MRTESFKYVMTYNNKNMSGCSARGIALRNTKEEIEALHEKLKESIYNVKIEKIEDIKK